MKVPAWLLVFFLTTTAATVLLSRPAQHPTSSLSDIKNVIIIYAGNWSFDASYGTFPGANGIERAGKTVRQIDRNGKPYLTLPQPVVPDSRIPADLPLAPFDLAKYLRPDEQIREGSNRFYQEQLQIDKG